MTHTHPARLTAPPAPPPPAAGWPKEHPIRCAATLDAPLHPTQHIHSCVHSAKRPEGVVGLLEHRCVCGATWTERTDPA